MQTVQGPFGTVQFPDGMTPEEMDQHIRSSFFTPPKFSTEEYEKMGMNPIIPQSEALVQEAQRSAAATAPLTTAEASEDFKQEAAKATQEVASGAFLKPPGEAPSGEVPPAPKVVGEMAHAVMHPIETMQRGTTAALRLLGFTSQEEYEQTMSGIIHPPQFATIPKQEGKAAQVSAGVANAAIDFVNAFSTPDGAATLGLGALPTAIRKAVLTVFAATMANSAPKQLEMAGNAAQEGDLQEATRQALGGAGSLVLSTLAARHATQKPGVIETAKKSSPAAASSGGAAATEPSARAQETRPATAGESPEPSAQAIGITPQLPAWLRGMFAPSKGPYRMGPLRRRIAEAAMGREGPLPKEMREEFRAGLYEGDALAREVALKADDVKARFDQEFPEGSAGRGAAREQLGQSLGDPTVSAPGSAELQAAAKTARSAIDQLTARGITTGAFPEGKVPTLEGNLGKWLRREYQAFFPEFRRTYDELSKQRSTDKEVDRVMSNAEAWVAKEYPKANVEAEMRRLLDRRETESAIVEVMEGAQPGVSKKGKIDMTSLIRRKELPTEVRELLGEIKDPFWKLKSSGRWLGQYIAKNDAQQAVREWGLKNGFFSEKPEGRNAFELAPDKTDFVPKLDANGNPMYDAQGNALGDYRTITDLRYRPLRNLYTSQEFKAAFDRAMANVDGPSRWPTIDAMIGGLLKAVSFSKWALVPANPKTWPVNLLSGMFMTTSAGSLNPFIMKRAANVVINGDKAIDGPASGRLLAARADYLNSVRGGMLDESVLLGELRQVAEFDPKGVVERGQRAFESFSEGAIAAGLTDLGKALKQIGAAPGRAFIEIPDNFFRVTTFLHEMETARRAFPQMPMNERVRWAGHRAENTYQTYRMLPAWVRQFSRIGAFGTFVQFPFELMRNQFHNARYALQDMASGNPELIKAGAKRAMAIAGTYGAIYGLSKFFQQQSGISDDQMTALQRSFVQPWDRNEVLIAVDKDGPVFSYAPLSYIVPQAEVNALWRAAKSTINEPNSDKAFTMAMQFLGDEYLGPGTIFQPLAEAGLNKRASGGVVTRREGRLGFWERVRYALTKPFTPGVVRTISELNQSLKDEGVQTGEYGKVVRTEDIVRQMAGMRVRTLDVSKQLSFKMRDLRERWTVAQSAKNTAEVRFGSDSERAQKEAELTDATLERIGTEYSQLIQDAQTLGVDLSDILKQERERALPQQLRFYRMRNP